METFLLGFALVVFAGLTLNCLRLAFSTSTSWGVLCSLVPLAWLPFYGIHWRDLRIQGVIHGVSLVAVLLFSALYIRANPFVFDGHSLALIRDWVAPAYGTNPLPISTHVFASDYDVKRLQFDSRFSTAIYQGGRYQFEQVVLNDGILRFKQLEPNEPLEFVIDLSTYDLVESGHLMLDLTPESPQVPLVHVMQYREGYAVPEVESFDRDYWMELLVNQISEGRYEGQVTLKLADGRKSFLTGSFSAVNRDLLWEFGDVKRSYDSNATIEYIAEQYLINNLGSSLNRVESFAGTFFQTNLENSTAHTSVVISMVDGSAHNLEIELFKNEQGWVVERSPVRDLISALQTIRQEPPAAILAKPVLVQTRTYAPEDMDKLIGQNVSILTFDGKTREGLVDEVDRYNVKLVTYLGGGEVALMVKRREVKEVVLKE